MNTSTIAALATAPGKSGLSVIRMSGPEAKSILDKLFVPSGSQTSMIDRQLTYGHLYFEGEQLDECMAVMMFAPRSYTREDVAEIQVHGGELVVANILNALYKSGAQPAQAGEFTRRAFENGRIDLSQAEAVMQLISASGRQAADAALRQLQGGTLRFVKEAQDELIRLMAGVTAAIDYPEEIDQDEAVGEIAPALNQLASRLREASDKRGALILEEGLSVVLCGKPNAGKSSLLNALLLEDRAIVTEVPGTTRDTVTGSIYLNGIRINLKDTAGIRHSDEQVEQIGIQRAKQAIISADLRLMVFDKGQKPNQEDLAILELIKGMDNLYLFNKSDLPEHPDFTQWLLDRDDISPNQSIHLSAQSGEGMELLRERLQSAAGQPAQNALTLKRHIDLALLASSALNRAANAMEEGLPLDICAVDLNEALAALGQITGENFSESLLDQVFSSFCVGK